MSSEGICCLRADHGSIRWTQPDFEQTRICLSGKLRLLVEDSCRELTIIEALPGECIYLPAGYTYTLEPAGVDTLFFWTCGAPDETDLVEASELVPGNMPPSELESQFDAAVINSCF